MRSPCYEAHQEKDAKTKDADEVKPGAVPAYLLDREQVRRTKARGHSTGGRRGAQMGGTQHTTWCPMGTDGDGWLMIGGYVG